MNVPEFVFGDIEYNDMTDEDVTDDVKQSGVSPLDVLINLSRLDLPPSVRDTSPPTATNTGGHISEGRVILSLIWSTIICKLMEANIVLNVLLVQY